MEGGQKSARANRQSAFINELFKIQIEFWDSFSVV